jgi:hypothetical protein
MEKGPTSVYGTGEQGLAGVTEYGARAGPGWGQNIGRAGLGRGDKFGERGSARVTDVGAHTCCLEPSFNSFCSQPCEPRKGKGSA